MENRWNFDRYFWSFKTDDTLVQMPEAVFRQHLHQELERLGLPTKSYLELMDEVQRIYKLQYQAMCDLTDIRYWREHQDAGVRMLPLRWLAPSS